MRKVIALLVLEVFVGCGLIYSQNIASSIVGRVTDASGAAVPGVQVTVINAGTGASTTVTTGSSGTYSVPELLSGEYSVKATKAGFQTYTEHGLRLYSAETSRVDIAMKVGNIHQTVSVVGRAQLIHTDSMGISSSVTTRQLSDLPTALQTVDAFISLAPGVQAYGGDMANPPIGGGTHWGSVNFTLNGVGANQPGNSGGVDVQGVGLLVLPPPSSIQELKVQSDNMTAEYKAHSAVTLVTKGGTNRFHGEAYEYLQNTDLNANQFLLNASGSPRAPVHLNQFGGNLGGPIWRNKAFFFFDYTGYRHQDSVVTRHAYPSMAMRQGDFSALCTGQGGTFNSSGICSKGNYQLYNPFTGEAFANNQIPSGLITSQSNALMRYLPAPTDSSSLGLPSGSPNYIGLIPRTQNVNSEDARIDYNASSRDRIFGVYAQRNTNPWFTSNGYAPDYGEGRSTYKNYSVSASETHTFNATTLNVFRVAWGDYIQQFSGQNGDFNLQSLFPSAPATLFQGLPGISATGYDGLWHDVGTAYPTPQWDVEITDDFTHISGRHTFKAGIDETGYKIFSRHTTGTNTGTFAFNGKWTGNAGWPDQPTSGGNAFADFLLGTASSSATPGIGVYAKMVYSRDWGTYIQDTWQVRPNLTVNYGLRYEYQTPWQYRNQEVTTIDLNNVGGIAGTNSPLVLPQSSATPTLPVGADPSLFAAYPFETTQTAGLPLQYVTPDKNNFAPRVGIAWRPFGGTNTVIRAGYGIYFNFQPGDVGSRVDAWDPPWVLGYTASYATSLPGRTKLKSPYLPDITFSDPYPGANGNSSVAAHPSLTFFDQNFKNASAQEWNLTVEHQFGSTWATRVSYVGSQTHHIPYNAGALNVPVTQTPDAPLQAQYPLQPWGTVNMTRSAGKQNFNQLQMAIQHRFASGFSVNANYQYTRSLDNVPTSGGPQNWHFANLDYGNSEFIHRHWLTFSYIYQLPVGRGQRWLSGLHGVGDAVLGGWQVSGISHYATGTPFSVGYSQAGVKGIVGWWGGRADAVSGAPLYQGQQTGHDIVNGVQWFNTGAFAPPAQWTWGNSARDMVFGPGSYNWDISVMKTFSLPEQLHLQFRSDFLDAFNHFNLSNPNGTIADTRDGGNAQPNAGRILGGSGYRLIQLSLRLQF